MKQYSRLMLILMKILYKITLRNALILKAIPVAFLIKTSQVTTLD